MGPWGFLRLEIPIGDFGEAFNEWGSGREFSAQDRSKKKATVEDVDSMLQMVRAGHDDLGGISDSMSALSSQFSQAVAVSRQGQLAANSNASLDRTGGVFEQEGMMLMPDFDDLMDMATPKKKKAKRDASAGAGEAVQSDESGDGASGEDVEEAPP